MNMQLSDADAANLGMFADFLSPNVQAVAGSPSPEAETEFWQLFDRSTGSVADPEAETNMRRLFDDESTGDGMGQGAIKTEADSLIGADGSTIDSYIAREQAATHRTLAEDLAEVGDTPGGIQPFRTAGGDPQSGESFLGHSDADSDFELPDYGGSDTDYMPLGEKRSIFNPRRYTQGKYKDFEGEFAIGDDFADDDDVREFVDQDPDINSGVPETNALDGPTGQFEAEPMGTDVALPEVSTMSKFSWKNPLTWHRAMDHYRAQQFSEELREPLLQEQGTEMVDLGERNMRLADRPSPAEASPEITPEVRAGLNDLIGNARASGLGDAAIASEMGIGVSSGGGMWISRASLKDYLTKQGKGLMMTPLIAPLTLLLNDAQDGLGDMFSLGLISADMLTTGDPLGILVYGVGQLWDAANQSRQKVIDNDEPDKNYGSRLGYVREGDTWYPAIYNSKYKSTGLWAKDQQMTLDYGHDLVWKVNGMGSFVPMIPGAKSKNFVASDDELDKEKTFNGAVLSSREFVDGVASSDRDHVKMSDTTRDWYFLSDEDTKRVMSGDLHLESYAEDETQMNGAHRQINDWRKALDYGQDWKWSSAVQTMGPGAAVNNYAGSRGLQRVMIEGVQNGASGVYNSSQTDYDQYLRDSANRTGEDYDSGHGTGTMFSDYLLKTVLRDHIAALYRTQKEAAAEAGFDKRYQSKVGAALEAQEPDKLRNIEGGTVWSAMYLDTGKDLPVASSAEELAEQLHSIEMYNDRTPAQRNYLAQKAQTRYWMQQVVGMGQSTELLHALNGRDWNNGDPYEMKKYTATATAEFADYMEFGRGSVQDALQRGDSLDIEHGFTADQHLDSVPGFAMPWQNAGESWLPTLSGTFAGTSSKDYMDDFRATAYDRLSKEAAENTALWINETGALDPNLLIDGVEQALRPGGLYATSEQPASNTVTFADQQPEQPVPEPEQPVQPEQKPLEEEFDADVLAEARKNMEAEKAREAAASAQAVVDNARLDAYKVSLGGKKPGGSPHDEQDDFVNKLQDVMKDPTKQIVPKKGQIFSLGDAMEMVMHSFEDMDGARDFWERMGQKAGFLPDGKMSLFKADQNRMGKGTTDAHSHVPDPVTPGPDATPHHIVGDHPMHAYSAATLAAMRQWDAPSSTQPAVKVV